MQKVLVIIIKKLKNNNKLILKSQQKFRRQKDNVFTEEVNKIELITNNDAKIQSIDSIEIYAYGTSNDLVCKKRNYM